MRRRAFDILCVLSLLVAVLAAGLWARGLWWATDRVWMGVPGLADVDGISGQWWLYVGVWPGGSPKGPASPPRGWHRMPPGMGTPEWRPRVVRDLLPGASSYGLLMPHPWNVGLALALPAAWCVRRARRKTFEPGCCPACGYDLRGTAGDASGGASGGACPECGSLSK